MKKMNQLDVWMISRVSAFLGQTVDGTMEDFAHWILEDGSQVAIDFSKKEFQFIDWIGDEKTYYSLVGIAAMGDFEFDDYYTEK